MTKAKQIVLKQKDWIAVTVIGVLASLLSMILIYNLEISIPYYITFFVFVPLTIVGLPIGATLGKKWPALFQFVKFGETGGLNVLVDFGVLNLLIIFTGLATGLYFTLFKAISFMVATVHSFFWNKLWVFDKTEEDIHETGVEFAKFFTVTMIGLVINVGIATLIVFALNNLNNASNMVKIWANVGVAGGSIMGLFWNFFGYKKWAFKK